MLKYPSLGLAPPPLSPCRCMGRFCTCFAERRKNKRGKRHNGVGPGGWGGGEGKPVLTIAKKRKIRPISFFYDQYPARNPLRPHLI